MNGLSKNLFWDVDPGSLDMDKHAQFIITRIACRGTLSEWEHLNKIYSSDKIKSELVRARSLDKRTLSFLSVIFDLPKESFRCYTMNASARRFWNY